MNIVTTCCVVFKQDFLETVQIQPGFSYFELQSSTKQEYQSYCTWLLSPRFPVDLIPPMKDLIRYLNVKDKQSQRGGECFEKSTVRRTMNA
jgi:hypothetical protein